jgi:putative NIF3 family GTP cyclohydrolase 1 type 2
MKSLSLIFSSINLFCILSSITGQQPAITSIMVVNGNSSAGKIIETIIGNTGSRNISGTVDIIKEGNPQTEIKGIATCMFATMDVLKQAVEKNCNLIIAHEPLYYNHLDETKQFQNDQVFLQKQQYIREHKLVIWRFHDYIHSMKPDGIETGMVSKLGWQNYLVKGTTNRFVLPETTLSELCKNLKTIFPKNGFYVVGNPDMKLTKVSMAVGAPGSGMHLRLLEDKNTDVVLAGEAQQWETYEYTRDAVAQGKNKAVIFLGHISSEEAGMDYCAKWLKTFIKDIPVTFIESGPAYWTY